MAESTGWNFDRPDTPLAVRVTGWASAAFYFVIASPIASAIWSLLAAVIFGIVITRPLRVGRPLWVSILVVFAFVVVLTALGVLALLKGQRWLQWLVFGKLRFPPIPLYRTRILATMMGCVRTIQFQWKPDDSLAIDRIAQSNESSTERLFRYYHSESGGSDWDADWASVQRVEYNGITFGEAMRSPVFEIISIRLATIRKLITPALTIFCMGYVWLLDRALNKSNPLPLVQFVLLSGFVIAALILVNFTVSLRRILISMDAVLSVLGKDIENTIKKDPMLADFIYEEIEQRSSEFEDLEGRELFPSIKIREGYTRILRNGFLWELLVNVAISFLVLALLLAVTWLVALVGGAWTSAETNTWAARLLLGLALMTPVFGLALWLAFFVLERFTVLITIVVTGLFLAIVPPLIDYAITGEVGTNVILTSVITGVAGILSSAIAELVKKRPTVAAAE